MKRILGASVLALALLASAALAQIKPQSSVNLASTLAATGPFQSIAVYDANRSGCTVQNTSANAQYVFFGPIASATIAKSVKLLSGQSVGCNAGPLVLTDQISISGTSGDTFYAATQ